MEIKSIIPLKDIPRENGNLIDSLILNYPLIDMDEIFFNLKNIKLYFNTEIDEYWTLDLTMYSGLILTILLPKEMTEPEVLKFIKPMTDRFDKREEFNRP